MDKENIREFEDFIKSIESEDIGSFKKEVLSFLEGKKRVLSLDEIGEKLISYRKSILEEGEFKEGDLVQWKDGLKNRRFPDYNEPAIIMEVLDEPIYNEDEEPASPYYNEPLTIKIGFLVDERDFITYLVNQRRLEKFAEK